MGQLLDRLACPRHIVRPIHDLLGIADSCRVQRYVALKIATSEQGSADRELRVLHAIREYSGGHPGSQHVTQLLDDFAHTGPNGIHSCFTFEVLGPNVSTVIDSQFPSGRLPGPVALRIFKQVALGIESLHQIHVGYGGR